MQHNAIQNEMFIASISQQAVFVWFHARTVSSRILVKQEKIDQIVFDNTSVQLALGKSTMQYTFMLA